MFVMKIKILELSTMAYSTKASDYNHLMRNYVIHFVFVFCLGEVILIYFVKEKKA